MKLGLINSAWLGTSVDTERGIRNTREIGFDTIDIFADPMEIPIEEQWLIDRACEESNLPVVSVVCCALGIADFNKTVRQFHTLRAKKHLDFGYNLKAKNLLLVAGEYLWQQEVIAPADQWKWAVEHVREIAGYADERGLDVAIELEPFHLSIVNSIGKMAQFLNDIDHPRAKANVDISHLALAKNSADELSALKGQIAHVHLSDCDGKKHGDLPPGRGTVDFLPYLKALSDLGFDGTVSIELEYSPEPEKIVDWVREAYQATDRMMQQLGIRS